MWLYLIGGGGWAAAPPIRGARPCLAASGPHFTGSPFRVFYSILELTFHVFSLCKSDMWTSFCSYSKNPLQK